MVTVRWKGEMVFEAMPPSGAKFVLDSHPETGGSLKGPTPVEALLASAAACSAMDVISILKKKRQEVTSYRIEIDGDRAPEGTWPRPFVSMTIRHIVHGENIDQTAVERAVQLSDEKYCSVLATLRVSPKITSQFIVEESPS